MATMRTARLKTAAVVPAMRAVFGRRCGVDDGEEDARVLVGTAVGVSIVLDASAS